MHKEKELRCFCRTNPLLATFGVDEEGQLFVRMKIYKGNRIYGEAVFSGGTVRLKCRNCLRWQRVVFRRDDVKLTEDQSIPSEAVAP